MIQFNLLPDVKLAFIRAQRQKRLVMTVSIIASGAAIGIFLILFSYVNGIQAKNMRDLTRDIRSTSEDLMKTEDLNKILTVQNQLGSLDSLHNEKMLSSRLFHYFQQVTPGDVTITQLDLDFEQSSMTITGKAPELVAVNTYIDSLKFTTYASIPTGENNNVIPEDAEQVEAFKDVVMSQFGRSQDGATYTITLSFDPKIFAESEVVELTVPQRITTRSNLERPKALFEQTDTVQGQ